MNGATSSDHSRVKIEELIAEFYADGDVRLGQMESTTSLPAPYAGMLDHHKHMTVTVEAFHGESVDVVVHQTRKRGDLYSREITLVTHETKKTVQYGIVRLNTTALEPVVWKEIESQKTPLGRVLIEHNVLREVELCELWRICAGSSLATLMGIDEGTEVCGRTALIYCNGEPAIELLEVVSPVTA